MKILSIGNSFSQDAHKWLKPICESVGADVYNVNLYIGGCPLQRHWDNYVNNYADYDYEVEGTYTEKITFFGALQKETWDIITFQQASNDCGIFESYMPYLKNLSEEVRKLQPQARLYIHQTWAYETDSTHPAFVNYHSDQKEMYTKLVNAYEEAAKVIDGGIIPSGKVIQYLRENAPEISVSRDGYHLSWIYGRYAAALTWYGYLFDGDVQKVSLVPEEDGETADTTLLDTIKTAVSTVLLQHTLDVT